MKKFLFILTMLLTATVVNAQFHSRKEVITYLCSKAFIDYDKEYKVTFIAKDVEFAGTITHQLQIFVNGQLKKIIDQKEVALNSYSNGWEAKINTGQGLYCSIFFNGANCPFEIVKPGHIICGDFFGLPIDDLLIEGKKW